MKLYLDESGNVTANPEEATETCDFEGKPFDIMGCSPRTAMHDFSWIDEDSIPNGWFDRMVELENAIEKILEEHPEAWFQVAQLKEKFGEIRVYFDVGGIEREVFDKEIDEATEWTRTHCCECGAPATLVSRGWRLPYCLPCAQKLNSAQNTRHKTDVSLESAFSPVGN